MHQTVILFIVLEVPKRGAVGSRVIRNAKNAMHFHSLEMGGGRAAGSRIIINAIISRLSKPCPIAPLHSKPMILLSTSLALLVQVSKARPTR